MMLYIDIDNKRLVKSATSDKSVSAPSFIQGDREPIEIHLLTPGIDNVFVDKIISENDGLIVGLGVFGGAKTLLTYTSSFAVKESGGVDVVLPLNTVQIETALANHRTIAAYLEVQYTSGEQTTTVLQTPCTIINDLIEDSPSVTVRDRYYTADGIDAMLHSVYDEQGNTLAEKGKWITVKISEGVYTQKFVGVER